MSNKISLFIDIHTKLGFRAALKNTLRYLLRISYISPLIEWLRYRLLLLRTDDFEMVQSINGSKMKLDFHPDSSRVLERKLAIYGIREPGPTEKYKEILQKFKANSDSLINIFDVGANVGYYVLLEAHILGKKGHIYALEPEPDNIARMKKNIQLNNYSNVKVLPFAAGAEQTTKKLTISGKANTHYITNETKHNDKVTEEVKLYPLDLLVQKFKIPSEDPLIIRMDVEGYEGQVFKGMSDLLNSKRPMYIFVELHHRENNQEATVIHLLKECGFELKWVSYNNKQDMTSTINNFDEIPAIRNSILFASKNLNF